MPSGVSGTITPPTSKSHTLRAILFASLAKGQSIIRQPLLSPDTHAMIVACRQLGAQITWQSFDTLQIEGVAGQPQVPAEALNAGNSGQVLRFVSAVAALTSGQVVMTGDKSICTQRPMTPLLSALTQLGVSCISHDGYAPITLHGPLQSGHATLSGEDSQPVSALLIAAAFLEGETTLTVMNPGEIPWVALTLDWFDRMGIAYIQEQHYTHYHISGNASVMGFHYRVPGDFSSLAYPLVAALLTGSALCIENVDMTDAQGDKAVIGILVEMGAPIVIDEVLHCLWVHRLISPLQGRVIDVNPFIDAVTLLAVVGCYATGTTYLTNAAIARHKECNRLWCITQELKKMGAKITETEDGLCIEHSPLHGSFTLQSYQDHRMVLSLTVAALAAVGSSKIHDVTCVFKSYPDFLKQMQTIGAEISV